MRFAFPISKTEKLEDGRLLIEGVATSEALDSQGDILDYEGSKAAFGKWRGNLREAHDPKKPVGKALDVIPDDEGRAIGVKAFISAGAKDTQEKVLDGTLAMFSVGGDAPRKTKTEKVGGKTARRVLEWDMTELSLVDVGANPDAGFSLAKGETASEAISEVAKDDMEMARKCAKCGGEMEHDEMEMCAKCNTAKGEAVEASAKPEETKAAEPPAEPVAVVDQQKAEPEPDLQKREVSQEERDKLADEKKAMPDGSFPIANASDLENAVKAFGRAKNKAAVKAHIKRRAKALGLSDKLPENWKGAGAEMTKSMEAWDIRQALDCLAGLEALRSSEEMEAASGEPEPPEQLKALDTAIAALKAFVASEAQEMVEDDSGAMPKAAHVVLVKAAAPELPDFKALLREALAEVVQPLTQVEKSDEITPRIEKALGAQREEFQSALQKAAGDFKAVVDGEVKAIREGIDRILAQPVPGRAPVRSFTPRLTKAGTDPTERVRVLEEMVANAPDDIRPRLAVELNRAKAAAGLAAGV